MRSVKFLLTLSSLEFLYCCYIRPLLKYVHSCSIGLQNYFKTLQNEAARIASWAISCVSFKSYCLNLNGNHLFRERNNTDCSCYAKEKNGLAPAYLTHKNYDSSSDSSEAPAQELTRYVIAIGSDTGICTNNKSMVLFCWQLHATGTSIKRYPQL